MIRAPDKPKASAKPKLLCVDDEPKVLEGLALHLHRGYEVLVAISGADGLQLLAANPEIAVVVSDMRMPAMNGAEFLARTRTLAPDATRILLTGQSDIASAIAAVNEGQIFRFLTKPCPPPTLLNAVEAAAEQHRLVTAERVLLEQTLMGAVKTLVDVLGMTNPTAFGRSTRIKALVSELVDELELAPRWPVVLAAELSQLGCVTLPQGVLDKLYRGERLDAGQEAMVSRAAGVTEELLSNIPRLEPVRSILSAYAKMASAGHPPTPAADATQCYTQSAAELLRVVMDYDSLEASQGAVLALDTMQGRTGRYDAAALQALLSFHGEAGRRAEIRELSTSALREGMILADDVKAKTGILLAARGYQITTSFIERLRNHPGTVQEPLRVIVLG